MDTRGIRKVLRRTPLRRMWINFKKLPGVKQVKWKINGERDRRYLKEWIPGIYDKYAVKPVKENKVVIIERRLDKLSDNFQQIYNDLMEDGSFDVHVHYLRNIFEPRKIYEKNCAKMIADMATARYVFMSEASTEVSAVNKRPETTICQLWHACGAFKKFGRSTALTRFGPSAEKLDKYPMNKNYDYVTISSPEIRWAYAEALDMKDREDAIVATGTSRTDVFFQEDFLKAAREHVYEQVPQARGKKILLYAPTFRGGTGDPQTTNYKQFDLKKLYDAIGQDWVVLIKHHQIIREVFLPKVPSPYKASFAFDVTGKLTIEDLLCTADCCISDYSSLIFEYSLFLKPMLFYAYDLDKYLDWRGFYYGYNDYTPGPVCKDMDSLCDELVHLDERFDKKAVEDFRNKFMASCDGHATERIEKLVFGRSLRKETSAEAEADGAVLTDDEAETDSED